MEDKQSDRVDEAIVESSSVSGRTQVEDWLAGSGLLLIHVSLQEWKRDKRAFEDF